MAKAESTKRIPHCETCTCGLTEIEWSDRRGFVDLRDASDIAERVLNCALDHSYDRTRDGIPDGYPRDLRLLLAPIVAKHLSFVDPDWQDKTVHIFDDEHPGAREAFLRELTDTATAWIHARAEAALSKVKENE